MSFKIKLMLIGLIGSVVILLISLTGTLLYYKELKTTQIQKTVASAQHNFDVAMIAKKKVWQTNALQIATNNDIKEAVFNKDRDKANQILKNIGGIFKNNTEFKNVQIHLIDKDLTSFYKSWSPDTFGEKLTHSRGYALVKKTGKSFAAMEMSQKGVRLKGLFPISFKDQFIGIANFEGGLNSIKRTLKPYDIDFLYFMDSAHVDIAQGMEKKPKLGNYILNQKDIDKDFFNYAQKNEVLEKLKSTNYTIDESYLVIKGAFKGFDGVDAGLYLLGIKTDVVLETINSLRNVIFTLFGFLSTVFLLLILGVIVFVNIKVIKPVIAVAGSMHEGAEQVATASGEISSSSQATAEGASQQAASLEETLSSMEEISSMTKNNAENAYATEHLMKEVNQVVKTANSSMKELTRSMDGISKASEETSKILKTIDEIAFQTNLLALNAAVEAARAGEAGAGFAVVADEVRNLALRAADSAKNSAEMIKDTIAKVNDGSKLASTTNEAFTKVTESAAKVEKLISEISLASKEQSRGIEQINIAITEMDKVSQSNAASAEESASSSEELYAQAEQLKSFVKKLVALVSGKNSGDANGIKEALSRGGINQLRAREQNQKWGTLEKGD
nr:methyl-accepting chemotaxis protein [uncultured Desulfobacter sp.]